jgi:ABC-type Fe3+/spermidine/putrescine transport system ATPase subunit
MLKHELQLRSMRVIIKNLTKRFGTTTALDDVSFEVASQELFFLLGPSGCGKTTLLRLVAGFYAPDGGEIIFGDRPINDVPPHKRNTGMVFQNYALWPHMTVADNVAYGLDVRGVKGRERKSRIAEALEIVQMSAYAERTPNQLSGGQQQRIALARALVIKPDLLLLDEPLSNLDAKLRLEMRDEIRRIHAQTKITTIYVTHDQKEALSLAQRMCVLRNGRVEQIGEPREVYRAPANRFVADFIGETNWLEGAVVSSEGQELRVKTPVGLFEARGNHKNGEPVLIGFRPEAVQFGNASNGFGARIVRVNYLGEIEQYALEISGGKVIKAFEQNPLEHRAVGTELTVHVRAQDVLVLRQSRDEPYIARKSDVL